MAKQYLSRSDEEIRDEMDKGGLIYRAGWPTLPLIPVEIVREGARAAIPDSMERIEEADTILQAQDIWNGIHGFVYRVPLDAPEDEEDLSPYLTFLCTFNISVFKQYEARKNVQIEVIDSRVIYCLYTFPIGRNREEIVERWEGVVAPIVLDLLKEHEWLSLEMVRRGFSDIPEECPPTIVITTPTARNPKWTRTIKPAISAAIANIAPDFEVEILCGKSLLGSRKKYKSSIHVNGTSYEKRVFMGSSIGISGDPSSCSTLGGSVILEGGVRCGITNWHCVRDNRLDKIISETMEKALSVDNKTLMNAPQPVLSPSTYDHERRQAYLQQLIQRYTAYAAKGQEVYKTLKKENEEALINVERASRNLGHVYAGSGHRTIAANKYALDARAEQPKERTILQFQDQWILDWALIRIDDIKLREVGDMLPPTLSPRASPLVPYHWCNKWSTFDANRKTIDVAKYGSTTGITFGTINPAIVYINPKSDAQLSAVNGFTEQTPASCFAVVMEDGKYPPFFEPGDSGSVVLHRKSGTQLGLLFGMTSCDNALFIPMDLVFQDIERITGKRTGNCEVAQIQITYPPGGVVEKAFMVSA
ncbi:hypothetical protein COCMIDRAFT_33414 [Bipolaris oryzae ATCC 44560]|uniref:Peptidase S1 domain-containing protein n=1 Tax=Bipolaris oryzae ATCC 44560 TaxID=930090 RepID=W6ZZG4_COCMI|nr:uncharacterized protein COCMIDRAFT_33414 [Bipolaris oryzae ATCC 44560]EUC49151.1 hypothetical protein COCMIDRAFT_33414 [Bipolaris oryzae ATCC 44560]